MRRNQSRGAELHTSYVGAGVRDRLRRVLLSVLTLPLLSLGGCPEARPGVELGRYLVIATRTAGTCGPQREDGSYSFQVDLTLRPGLIRWAETSGTPIDGRFDQAARSFRVSLEASATLAQPNRVAEYAGCTVLRQDVIDGQFQGEVPEPSSVDGGSWIGPPFEGTYSVIWSPVSGSDCSPYVGGGAQQWAALPCTTTYRLSATRR